MWNFLNNIITYIFISDIKKKQNGSFIDNFLKMKGNIFCIKKTDEKIFIKAKGWKGIYLFNINNPIYYEIKKLYYVMVYFVIILIRKLQFLIYNLCQISFKLNFLILNPYVFYLIIIQQPINEPFLYIDEIIITIFYKIL